MTKILYTKELCGSDLLCFKAVTFNLELLERLLRSSTTYDDQIKTLIENNPCYTTPELTEMLKISKSINQKYFVKFVHTNHFDVFFKNRHKLSEESNILLCLLGQINLFLEFIILKETAFKGKSSYIKRNVLLKQSLHRGFYFFYRKDISALFQ